MKRAAGVLLIVIGGGLMALGLLFLVGAAGKPHRFLVAAVGLGLGAVVAGFGVRFVRAGDRESPEHLQAEILRIARLRDGELSEAELAAALGRRAHLAAGVLKALVAGGVCAVERRDGGAWYLFRGLTPRLSVLRCGFCGTEQALSSRETRCARCGGALELGVESRPAASDSYRMDE